MAKTKTILHNKICNFSHVRMKVQMLAYHAGQTRSDTSSLLITLSHWNWIMAGRKPVQMEFHLYRHHPSHLGVTQWPFLEYTLLDMVGAKKAIDSNISSCCPNDFLPTGVNQHKLNVNELRTIHAYKLFILLWIYCIVRLSGPFGCWEVFVLQCLVSQLCSWVAPSKQTNKNSLKILFLKKIVCVLVSKKGAWWEVRQGWGDQAGWLRQVWGNRVHHPLPYQTFLSDVHLTSEDISLLN